MFGRITSLFGRDDSGRKRAARRAIVSLETLEHRLVPSSDPSAELLGYDWHGGGQVSMRVSGATGAWQSNEFTDSGSRQSIGRWTYGASQGDPVAYVANSTPSLLASFCVDTGVKTLQVKAEGGSLSFLSQVVPVHGRSATVSLAGQENVGNVIDNRLVTFQWFERINGRAWKSVPGGESTSQRLFVTHSQALHPGGSQTTARRMNYATGLAKGIAQSNTMAIADAISKDAMSRFVNRTEGDPWTGERAWLVMKDKGMCADDSWLMTDALGELGIQSHVCFVYPRTYSWLGLVQDDPEGNSMRLGSHALLGYVVGGQVWQNYEACCFVPATHRYYLGGMGGQSAPTAFQVLETVTGPGGARQAWGDDFHKGKPVTVPWPKSPPPTY
jgi:hypothetical protein